MINKRAKSVLAVYAAILTILLAGNALSGGFGGSSPSTGNSSLGNVINLANVNYNNGVVGNTSLNDNIYWAAGVSNGGVQQNDPNGYLNISYNITDLGLSNPNQIMSLEFNILKSYVFPVDFPLRS